MHEDFVTSDLQREGKKQKHYFETDSRFSIKTLLLLLSVVVVRVVVVLVAVVVIVVSKSSM